MLVVRIIILAISMTCFFHQDSLASRRIFNTADEAFINLAAKYPVGAVTFPKLTFSMKRLGTICYANTGGSAVLVDIPGVAPSLKGRVALTAAHVIKHPMNAKPRFLINQKSYKATAIPHPGYNADAFYNGLSHHDLSILILNEPVESSPPAKVDFSISKESLMGQKITLIGCGTVGRLFQEQVYWDKLKRACTSTVGARSGELESEPYTYLASTLAYFPFWYCDGLESIQGLNASELPGIAGPGDSGGACCLENGDLFGLHQGSWMHHNTGYLTSFNKDIRITCKYRWQYYKDMLKTSDGLVTNLSGMKGIPSLSQGISNYEKWKIKKFDEIVKNYGVQIPIHNIGVFLPPYEAWIKETLETYAKDMDRGKTIYLHDSALAGFW